MSADGAGGSGGKVSRRTFLAGAAGAGAGLAVGAAAGVGSERSGVFASDDDAATAQSVVFWGEHQAGIATPAQDRLQFAALDLTTTRRQDVADLMRTWTDAASRMCAGDTAAALATDAAPPPADSGEAIGLAPARLTITFGFGPSLFSADGADRFGLASLRPAALIDLPAFPNDLLDSAKSGGDIAIQACADDPQVAFHAVRNLVRVAHAVAVPRWYQTGFGRTSSTSASQATPRNLMGFKDGTNNIKADDAASMQQFVWAGDEGPAWMRGGSYMVARRINIRLEAWDRDSLGDQETRVGRQKMTGAPLGGVHETDAVDLDAQQDGAPVIPPQSHIRLASHATNDGARILRRGYSFLDGLDANGESDAGLFFICYQRDPRTQFVPIQSRLAEQDALNLYLIHTGSAVFACPRGAEERDWVGRALFGG
jgi:deferrochelatase/peroxidase EfeB